MKRPQGPTQARHRLYDKKNYEGSLAEFEQAYKEKPSAGFVRTSTYR